MDVLLDDVALDWVVRPLDGVRVLDFGQYVAGPMAATLLADAGAEVTRIEPPGGPRFTDPGNAYLLRGRAATHALDLKSPEGRNRALALVAGADVLIENFRPGVMARLGLDAATGEYVDMIKEGIIDPAKVTRSALQNAASIAALFLTTEVVVADKPEKAAPMGGDPSGGMGGMDF